MCAKIKNFFYFKVLYTYLAYRSITVLLLFCLIISFQMSCFIFTIESALFTHIVQCADDNTHIIIPEIVAEKDISRILKNIDAENYRRLVILPFATDPGNRGIPALDISDFINLNYSIAIRNLPD